MAEISDPNQLQGIATLLPQARADFVETETVKSVVKRALAYLRAGYSVHFRGPAGTGKTTLAFHTAALLGRPAMMITGDEEMRTSNLVGAECGYNYRKVVDRYIHSVTKMEEYAGKNWAEHRLTTACRKGYTLIYDEFTRSRAEANNVLLGVLEEKLLVLPAQNQDEAYIKVHPEFRAIFTSNPQEYAGVHESQDALGDRIVTIDIGHADRELEVSIAAARSGLDSDDVSKIVGMVREFRETNEYDQSPTLRTSITICKVVAQENMTPSIDDPYFVQICLDILGGKSIFTGRADCKRQQQEKLLSSLIEHHCPSRQAIAPQKKAGVQGGKVSPINVTPLVNGRGS